MKIVSLISLLGLFLSTGCATRVEVEPVRVYYGWCGTYYGPYYWGPTGVIIFGTPPGWHGIYRSSPTINQITPGARPIHPEPFHHGHILHR